MTSILMYGELPWEILRKNRWHIRPWVGVYKSWWKYRCTKPYNWFSYTLNYYNYWQYILYSNGYTEVHEGCVIRNINCIGEFAKLLMGLVVLVKIMSVLINFLLQNTNLVSVLIKICPNYDGHIWQDWQYRELWQSLHEHMGSLPNYFIFWLDLCCSSFKFLYFACHRSVSCVQCCLWVWIVLYGFALRLSLTCFYTGNIIIVFSKKYVI